MTSERIVDKQLAPQFRVPVREVTFVAELRLLRAE